MSENDEKGFLSDLMNGVSGGIGKPSASGVIGMIVSAVMGIFIKKKTDKMVNEAMAKAAASQAEAQKAMAEAQKLNANSVDQQ